MSFARKWKSYQRLTEAMEQTPFKSAAQKRYKRQRQKNDIYTTKSGIKTKKGGAPFTGAVQRFGTSKLRFESLREQISQQALRSFEVNDTLEPEVWEDNKIKPEVREALLKIVKDF